MTPHPGSDEALLTIAAELRIAVPKPDAPPAVRCCGVSLGPRCQGARGSQGTPGQPGLGALLGVAWSIPQGWVLGGFSSNPSSTAAGGARDMAMPSEAVAGPCVGARGAGPCKTPALGCCVRLAVCRGLWPLPEQELQVLCLGSSEGLCLPWWLGWYFSHCW